MGELSELDMPPSAAMPSSFQRLSRAVKTEAGVPVPLPSSSSFSSPSSSASSCPSPSPSSSSVGGNEQFPVGMRVLLVDDDRTCLKILSQMLCRCNYQVTPCSKATDALALLRSNWGGYDMVISDVYMPDMDGFKLLELVGLEMDLPVIMMSANGDTGVVMKGITHGACDYLLKPVRMEELRNIWQHVVRRKRDLPSSADEEKQRHCSGDDHRSPLSEGPDATGGSYRHSKKRKEGSMMVEEEEDEEHEGEDLAGGAKKARVVWSVELHQQFVNAVNQLGIDKAVPKRILELMNVLGLTRENVASHLQKYRLYLKRISGVSSEAGGGLTNNPPPPPSSTLGDLQALAAAVQLSPQALSSTLLHQLSLPNALGAALTTDPALLLNHLASMQAGGSNSSTTTSVLLRTPFGQPSGRLPELNPAHNALLMQYLQQSYRLPSIGSHVSANEVGINGLSQLKSNPLPSNLLSSNLTLPYELGNNGLPLPLLKPNPPPSNILSSNPSLSYEVGSNGLPPLKSNLLGLNPTSLPYEVGSDGLPQLKPNQSPSNLLGLNPTSLPYELGSNGLPQLKPNLPPSNLLSLNPTLPYEVGSNGLPLLKPNPPPSNLLSSNPSLSYEVGCNDLSQLKINSSLTNLIGSNPTLPYEVGSNDLPQLKRNSSLTNLIGSKPTLPYEVGSNGLPHLKGNSSLTNLLGSNPNLPFEVGSNGFPQLKPNPPLSNLLRSNSTLSYEGGSNGLPELKPNPSPSNLLSSNPTSLPYASLASSEVESEGGFNPIYSPNMAANGMTKLSQYTTSNPNSSNHPGWQALGLHHNVRQSTTATSPLASPRCHDIGSFGSRVNNDQMQAWATTPFASHNGSNIGNTTTSSRQSKPSFGHIPNRYEQPSIVEAGNEFKIEEGSHDLLVGSRASYMLMPETLKQRQDGFSESDFVGGNIGLNNMYVK